MTLPSTQPYRATPRHDDAVFVGVLAADNGSPVGSGASDYNELYEGTVLSRDSNGKSHPCGWQKVVTADTSVNVAEVEDASNFYIGDTIQIRNAAYTAVVASAVVTNVDKAAHTITFDGSAVNLTVGDNLLKTGAWQPSGFLDGNRATKKYRGTTAFKTEKRCDVRTAGDLRKERLTGFGEPLEVAMKGGPYTSPVDGSTIVPLYDGYVFHTNV